MDEREGKGSEPQEGISVRIDLSPRGLQVVNQLSEKFGVEAQEVLQYVLQEGAEVMLSRPPDYYKIPLNDSSRRGKFSEHSILVDEENLQQN